MFEIVGWWKASLQGQGIPTGRSFRLTCVCVRAVLFMNHDESGFKGGFGPLPSSTQDLSIRQSSLSEFVRICVDLEESEGG